MDPDQVKAVNVVYFYSVAGFNNLGLAAVLGFATIKLKCLNDAI